MGSGYDQRLPTRAQENTHSAPSIREGQPIRRRGHRLERRETSGFATIAHHG